MTKKLTLIEAVTAYIVSLAQPIITDYQIGLFIFQSYQLKEYNKNPLRLKKQSPEITDYKRVVEILLNRKIISRTKEFPDSVFIISNKPPVSAEEFVCLINPFTYISHLSAMGYHGFSDYPQKKLYLSSPASSSYRNYVVAKMERDSGGEKNLKKYYEGSLPRLKALEISEIENKSVNIYHSNHIGSFQAKGNIKIANVERTFLDMLRKPDCCGGMQHVIQVYKKYALKYLTHILKEINEHGKPIEKVRAGYILEEYCDVEDVVIESWLKFVQRGGSRKLDPLKKYSTNYSERWCLSLNI